MKVHKLPLVIIFIITLILFSYKPSDINLLLNITNNTTNNLGIIHTKYDFINIFISNLVVGLVLSIIGFFTGGLITFFIIVWNLLLIWILYSNAIYNHNSLSLILYLSKHVPLEIYAFTLFSIVGFRGFGFYKQLIVYKNFDIKLFPNIYEIIFPSILLFFSSSIEVL